MAPPAKVRIEDVIRMYREGKSMGRIADELGVTPAAIQYRLNSVGEPTRPGSAYYSDFDMIQRRYLAGEPVERIAADLGVVPAAIYQRLRAHGCPKVHRRPRKRIPVDTAELARRYEAGETLEAIGRVVGMSLWGVRKRLLEVGVAMRPGFGRSGPTNKTR